MREQAGQGKLLPPTPACRQSEYMFFPLRTPGARGKVKPGRRRGDSGRNRGRTNNKCCLFSLCPEHVAPENDGCDLGIMPSCLCV